MTIGLGSATRNGQPAPLAAPAAVAAAFASRSSSRSNNICQSLGGSKRWLQNVESSDDPEESSPRRSVVGDEERALRHALVLCSEKEILDEGLLLYAEIVGVLKAQMRTFANGDVEGHAHMVRPMIPAATCERIVAEKLPNMPLVGHNRQIGELASKH